MEEVAREAVEQRHAADLQAGDECLEAAALIGDEDLVDPTATAGSSRGGGGVGSRGSRGRGSGTRCVLHLHNIYRCVGS
jgi:hypothetical protein